MSVNEIPLEGTWSIATADGRHATDYAVPGDVHVALVKAGIIAHPYIGRNEYAARWVLDEEWVARRSYSLAGEAKGNWYLDVDQLDTVTDVQINGEIVPRDGDVLFLSWRDQDGGLLHSHFAHQSCKSPALVRPDLRKVLSRENGTLRIELAADRPAFYVMAECSVSGSFSDNVVDLLPGETVTPSFTPGDPLRLDEAMDSLVIRDLYPSFAPKRD